MSMTTEELKEKMVAEYDPDDLVDMLEVSSQELLDAFEDRLEEKAYRFREFDDATEETQE